MPENTPNTPIADSVEFVIVEVPAKMRAAIGSLVASTFLKNPALTSLYVSLAGLDEKVAQGFAAKVKEMSPTSPFLTADVHNAEKVAGLKTHIRGTCKSKKVPVHCALVTTPDETPLGYRVIRDKSAK